MANRGMTNFCSMFLFLVVFTMLLGNTVFAQVKSVTHPIGIVADGQNYEINTNAILSSAHINSIGVKPHDSGASLQLNAILHVITNNATQDYWLQNMIEFPDTDLKDVFFGNNMWNVSNYYTKICLRNTDLQLTCEPKVYYKYVDEQSFQMPFDIALVTSEKTVPGIGVQVQFSYLDQNGTKIYDNEQLVIPGVKSSSFLITSNTNIRNWMYYDAEFVWGGLMNGEIGNFTSMNSTLLLFYNDGINNENLWKRFSGYTNYGRDTTETAHNIYSVPKLDGPTPVLWGNYSIISAKPISTKNISPVPEFGTLAYVVFLIGIITTIIISTRLRSKMT